MDKAEEKVKPGFSQYFFQDVYAPKFLKNAGPRNAIIVFFALLTACSLFLAVQLEPSDKEFRAETFQVCYCHVFVLLLVIITLSALTHNTMLVQDKYLFCPSL